MWSDQILKFQRSLSQHPKAPAGIDVLQPVEGVGRNLMQEFYQKFYRDSDIRVFLVGINPGRFGAGITGIPFTDPIRLQDVLQIQNDLAKKPELSSRFIYEVIEEFGGPRVFYRSCYITSTCPLGFTKAGKNYNYYDDRHLMENWKTFMVQSLQDQLKFGPHIPTAFSLGKKNGDILRKWNSEYSLFSEVIDLPHPRWVMQYRLKKKSMYIQEYVDQISQALSRVH